MELISNVDKLFCEDSLENIKQSLLAFIDGKLNYKTQYVTKNLLGEKIDILMQWSMPHDDITHVLISVVDISVRVKSQKLLEKSERRFRELADFLPVGIFEFDENRKVAFLNKAAKELAGIIENNIDKDKFNPFDFLLPQDKAIGSKFFDLALKGKTIRDVEYNVYREKSDPIPILVSTAPILENDNVIGIRGAATDISKLKNIEKELRESEKRYKEIFEKDFSAIIVTDINGNILECNPSYVKLLGLKSIKAAKSINSKSIYLNPEQADELRDELKQKGELKNYEITLKDVQGEIRYALVNASAIYNNEGEMVALRAYLSDYTEKKTAQLKLQEYKNDLEKIIKERTQQLRNEIEKQKAIEEQIHNALEKEKELNDLKTSFISTASHEFRTPLTAIRLYTDLIGLLEPSANGELVKYVGNIQSAVKNMTTLIDDVLTISRTETGKISFDPKPLNLYNFTQKILAEVETACKINHTIEFNYRIDKKNFLLDEKLLRHMFQNLLCNAMKYSPNGGKITLEIYTENDLIMISIKDEGIGIANEDLNKLFEPFYRTTNSLSIEGTGLGLTIVKRSVDLHGGIISISSELNKGSNFSIGIPIKYGKEEKNNIN